MNIGDTTVQDILQSHDKVSHFTLFEGSKNWISDDLNVKEIPIDEYTIFTEIEPSQLDGNPFEDHREPKQKQDNCYMVLIGAKLYQMHALQLSSEELKDPQVNHFIISPLPNPVQKQYDSLLNSLTERESEVLTLLAKGFSMTHIAKSLSLSSHTIDSHRINLCKKLKVKRTTELAVWASRLGLLETPIHSGLAS